MKRIAIIYETGNGRLGGHHTHFSFTGLPGVEIAALADSNPEAEQTFRKTGAKRLYRDPFAMLETERPDIAVLCSRLPEDHDVQIRFAIEHGIHVLVEKPLASDLVQADERIEKAEHAGVRIQVAHLARFAPVFQEMKRRIEAGEIGRPLTCHMRGKEDSRGGGEDMMVLGTHLLDVSAWLFGLPETVCADVRFQGVPIRADDRLATEEPVGPCAGDEIFADFRYANGVRGIFESRRDMVGRGTCIRMGLVVSGTEGSLAVRYEGNRALRISRNAPTPYEDESRFEPIAYNTPPEIPGAEEFDYDSAGIDRTNESYRYFIDNNRRAAWNLLRAIEGKEELAASGKSAVASLEMIVGTYRSSLEGRRLALPLKNRTHPLRRA